LSPGMKYRHYAPNSKCVLVYSKNNIKIVDKINDFLSKYNNVTVVCCDENRNKYNATNVINYGSKYDLNDISKNIFSVLRRVDRTNPELVIIEGVEKKGIGLAIMNRLIRACSHEYIEIEEK